MNWTEWLIFILVIQVIHGLGTWKLYIKANRQAWEAFIPIYNAVILMKIITRPWWWIILMFLPVVNLIMIPAVWIETGRAFGKDSKLEALLCIITLGFYLYYLNYIANVRYIEKRRLKPKTVIGEWITAILFAIVAATIVHTYFFQPFVIPSSSLEKSLLVGDFLIVSKIHYGARTPMTTVAAPMVHDTIPLLKTKSYLFNDTFEKRNTSWLNKLQLPYFRLPGFDKIERNDIVVFNQPADTLLDMNNFNPDRNYYKPIDKKTNLVKRCVAISGDTIEVRNGIVYVNSKRNKLPDRAQLQFSHDIVFKNISYNSFEELNYKVKPILKKYNITDGIGYNSNTKKFTVQATLIAAKQAVIHPNIVSIRFSAKEKGLGGSNIFPHSPLYQWNNNYFGPLYIPKAGEKLNLTVENLPLYKRAIQEYEGHKVYAKGNQIFIDDKKVTSYIFTKDYYWMMGDNRHNSIDSRAWGFVPYDHIFGKPVFIWMSADNFNAGLKNWKIRWDRVFTTVGGNGERVSYLIPFLIVVIGFTVFNRWRKKRKLIQKHKP